MVAEYINWILNSDSVQILLVFILGMTAGKTIDPIPTIVKDTIFNSFFVKYIILVGFALRIFYPVTDIKVAKILIMALLMLVFIDYLRTFDRPLTNKEKEDDYVDY